MKNFLQSKKIVPLLILAGMVVGLAGCTLLPVEEPLKVYVLSPPVVRPQGSACECILRIHTPAASGVLNGSSIAVMPAPQQLSVYKGVRWNANLPRMLHDYLITSFRASQSLQAVLGDDYSVAGDYALNMDLRAFQSSYVHDPGNGGNPLVEVGIDAQLVDTHAHRILAQRSFRLQEPSSGTEVDAVVNAFNRAASSLSRQLLEWSVATIKLSCMSP